MDRRGVVVLAAIATVALVAPAAGQGKSGTLVWTKNAQVVTSRSFGTTGIGSSTAVDFKLRNQGTTKSGRLTVNLTGSPAFSVAIDGCTGHTLIPMKQCRVRVVYAPTAVADDSAVLTATSSRGLAASLSLSASAVVSPGSLYWANLSSSSFFFSGTVNSLPTGSSSVTTLASNQHYPYDIAADATNVYWINAGTTQCPQSPYCHDGSVNAVPRGGGASTILVSGLNEPLSIAVDGTNVYWTDGQDGTVNEVPLGGGTPTVLATGQNTPSSVAVDGTSVYWVDEGDPRTGNGSVDKVPIGGGSVTTLASGQDVPCRLAVDGAHVYWSSIEDGTVNESPLAGGAVTTLASGESGACSVAVNATNIYWADESTGTFNTGMIRTMPLGGGSATTLASGQDYPSSVAVDGNYVYWINFGDQSDNGTVDAMPLAGGDVMILASGQSQPQALAVGP